MFKSVIAYVDHLLVGTTITTTTTVTKTVYSTPDELRYIRQYCADHGIEIVRPATDAVETIISVPFSEVELEDASQLCTTIIASETEFNIGGTIIQIPELVQKMKPFDQVDVGHYCDFPLTDSSEILVLWEEPNSHRAADHYGMVPHDNALFLGYSAIKAQLEDLNDETGNPDIVSATAHYENMDLTSFIFSDWDYLVVQVGSIGRMQIAVPNHRGTVDAAQAESYEATWACILARAILITLRKQGKTTAIYNEHDLRSNILALLIADRSPIQD